MKGVQLTFVLPSSRGTDPAAFRGNPISFKMNLKRQISHIYFNKIKIPTLPASGLVRTSKEIRLTEPHDEHEEIMPGG